MDDALNFFGAILILALVIVVLTFGIVFIIPGAIAAAIIYGVYQKYNGPEAIANQAATETEALYQKAIDVLPYDVELFESKLENQIENLDLRELGLQLFADEGLLPPDAPLPNPNSIEGARYRDQLNAFIAASYDFDRSVDFVDYLIELLKHLDQPEAEGLFAATRQRSQEEIEELILLFFGEHKFFRKLREQLDKNFQKQDGIFPSSYTGTNCAWDYLKDTPLLDIERIALSAEWHNPENHTLVLAGSGAGKTTLFKHLIAHLLKDDVCVIVMDSQSQVIEELALLQLPDDEVAWITPDNPLALNPFYADEEEIADEAFLNTAIGQLEFVINKLLDAPMTPRQRTLFHHCTNLVMRVPDATITTFLEVLADPYEFAPFIDELDETGQRFFNEELRSKGKRGSPYDSTRTELSYRLDALLKNPTLRRMFNTPDNTFAMYEEMLDRKLVLIDTSIALLAEESATFGRFMIAQALQACYRRVKEKNIDRRIVFFIDEAHEYFDEKLETMLLQARKANVGMVIATQDMARATRAGIADTLMGSTTTKIVSRVVSGDARRLAPSMKTSPDHLLNLPDHSFAFFSGGEPAVTIRANPDTLTDIEKREDLKELREEMIDIYGPEPDKNDHEPRNQPPMSGNDDQDIEPDPKL